MTRTAKAVTPRRRKAADVDAAEPVDKGTRAIRTRTSASAPTAKKKTVAKGPTTKIVAHTPPGSAKDVTEGAPRGAAKKPPKRAGTAASPGLRAKGARKLGGAEIRRPSRRMSTGEIDALFERFSEADPTPTTELEFSTPYELLVAVALSAQATDISVNKATQRLFPVANTPKAIARLGVAGIAPYLTTINFNRTKAKNVVAMAEQLLALHEGRVPRDRAALEALPGVGRKTANVVLNTAFGETTLAVDTHIFRVSNRTGLAPGRDVRAVEDELLRVVPERYLQHAHHWLLLHGRYVCKARLPDCPRCIVRDLCHYPDKTPGAAPPLEVAPAKTSRRRT